MRLAVVSPFLDRQHGTELCVIEQIERLARLEGWTIELYSQRVEQVSGVTPAGNSSRESSGGVIWHKVSDIPGPYLLKYLWWFLANQWQRNRDRHSGNVGPDLVYSPGINCSDADVIVVHIVFHDFYLRVKSELALFRNPVGTWPRLIHRKLYYKLIMTLEQKIYRDPHVFLIAVSGLVRRQLQAHFGRNDVAIIPNAIDALRFTPEARLAERAESRKTLQYADDDFVVLLIGNDWKKKGLDTLLNAAALLLALPIRLLVVGRDDLGLYAPAVKRLGLEQKIRFVKPIANVLQFYAAVDLYAGPSLEDSFSLPIAEAMACGLPVIASVHAGASELIRNRENGMLLHQPGSVAELAECIHAIYTDATLRKRLGDAAARGVRAAHNWDHNAIRTRELLEDILSRRQKSQSST